MDTLTMADYSYSVVIRLKTSTAEAAEITLKLHPPTLVPTGDGKVKALRDCTLADLQIFAAGLEQGAWAPFRELRLEELAAHRDTAVRITIHEKATPVTPELETILSQVLMLPDDVPAAAVAEPEPDPTPPVAEEAPAIAQPDAAAIAAPPEAPVAAADADEPTDPSAETHPPVAPQLRIAGRRRPVGHPSPAVVDILINEKALRDAQAHALSSMRREVAGMMVGPRPEQKADGRWIVHVTDCIEAKHTEMRGASVTYTPESWRYIHDILAEKYPNEAAVIVGWYHTHPGFGIFLSGMDMFIHTNFFSQPWHIAFVLDPRARSSGFFCWNRQHSEVQPYDFPWPDWAPESW